MPYTAVRGVRLYFEDLMHPLSSTELLRARVANASLDIAPSIEHWKEFHVIARFGPSRTPTGSAISSLHSSNGDRSERICKSIGPGAPDDKKPNEKPKF